MADAQARTITVRFHDIDHGDATPDGLRPVLLCVDADNQLVALRTRGAPGASKPAQRGGEKKREKTPEKDRAAPAMDAEPRKKHRSKKDGEGPAESRKAALHKEHEPSPSSPNISPGESEDDAPQPTNEDVLVSAIRRFQKLEKKNPEDTSAQSLKQLVAMFNGAVYSRSDLSHRLRFPYGKIKARFVDTVTGALTAAGRAAISRTLCH